MNREGFFKAILTVLFLCCSTVSAADRLVPSEYPTIQSAIDAAVNGDTVIIAPGTYTGSGNRDIDFKGKAITVRSTDPNDPNIVNTTIIDCNGMWDDPHRGFYFHSGEDANSVLVGLTIQNGYGVNEIIDENLLSVGGAVFCSSSSPLITKCIFKNNTSSRGGAIFTHHCNPAVSRCVFEENSASYHGGAIYCRHSQTLITDCNFIANSAIYYGGAVQIWSSDGEVRNCVFQNNSGKYGAGLSTALGSPEIDNCTFNQNTAERGGGIFCGEFVAQYDTPKISNCTITNNIALIRGGGIRCGNNAIIKNCVILGNTGVNGGGVGFLYATTPLMTNSIIAGNARYRGPLGEGGGSGISIQHGSRASVVNCTIANNETAQYGGGIDVYISDPLVANCIIWNNDAEWGGNTIGRQIVVRGNFITLTLRYCDIEGGLANIKLQYESKIGFAIGNTDADPCFVDPCNDDYHLLGNSPCINMGDPNYTAEPNETDLDDRPRIIGGRIDMGAYEFNHVPIANAGPDQTVEAQAPWGAIVHLNGSNSSDADSTPGTNDDIVSFNWYEEIDPCDSNSNVPLGTGQTLDCNLPLGPHTIILEVTDNAGESDTDEVIITVQDTTPPQFSLSVTPTILWPLSKRMIKITPDWIVTDLCDPDPNVSLVNIQASEPAAGDIQTNPEGSIYLRAWRSSNAAGRIYTITFQAVDDSGNTAQSSATVTVPHDQRVSK